MDELDGLREALSVMHDKIMDIYRRAGEESLALIESYFVDKTGFEYFDENLPAPLARKKRKEIIKKYTDRLDDKEKFDVYQAHRETGIPPHKIGSMLRSNLGYYQVRRDPVNKAWEKARVREKGRKKLSEFKDREKVVEDIRVMVLKLSGKGFRPLAIADKLGLHPVAVGYVLREHCEDWKLRVEYDKGAVTWYDVSGPKE